MLYCSQKVPHCHSMVITCINHGVLCSSTVVFGSTTVIQCPITMLHFSISMFHHSFSFSIPHGPSLHHAHNNAPLAHHNQFKAQYLRFIHNPLSFPLGLVSLHWFRPWQHVHSLTSRFQPAPFHCNWCFWWLSHASFKITFAQTFHHQFCHKFKLNFHYRHYRFLTIPNKLISQPSL